MALHSPAAEPGEVIMEMSDQDKVVSDAMLAENNRLSRRGFLAASAALPVSGALAQLTPQPPPAAPAAQPAASQPVPRIPVIYGTDLLYPHDDPDDYFDVATLFAMPELDVRAIVLDQGDRQAQRPGFRPVWQLNQLTGRNVPAAIGLRDKLTDPADQGRAQPPEFQNGVSLILSTLEHAEAPVAMAFVGSARDVVAAFNRRPDLFRAKVSRIVAFIGEASNPGFTEWNVGLDPQAYIGLMRSGLPVYWVPCFDGGEGQNHGHGSFWQIKQKEVLADAPPQLTQYFIDALWPAPNSAALSLLSQPPDPARRAELMAGDRNLWGAALLGFLSGRRIVPDASAGAGRTEKFVSVPPTDSRANQQPAERDIVGFSPVEISISDQAVVSYGAGPQSRKIMRFEIRDLASFVRVVTSATADLLARFPVQR
jgi:hypothetical protein